MRINYYLKKIKSFVKLDFQILRKYGLKASYYDFLKNFIFRANKGYGKKVYFKKYENIKRILYVRYERIIKEYTSSKTDVNQLKLIDKKSNIWFFWWQGIDENTPELVRCCKESIERNCKDHKLIVITKDNIKDYVNLPDVYYEKLRDNKITLTHFSDILRVELLKVHGGVWSDASFYWNNPLPDEVYNLPFYTIKHGLLADFHVCKGLWTDGFIASSADNPMFNYLSDLFREYWMENDFLLCYLLIDSFISIAYENWELFKSCIDKVPYNNKDLFFIDLHGNEKYDEKIFLDIANTKIFRVHYKKTFKKIIKEGTETYFGHLTDIRTNKIY